MCGRYYTDEKMMDEIKQTIHEVILEQVPVLLARHSEYEQQTLF